MTRTVASRPKIRACRVCYTPVSDLSLDTCAKHVGWTAPWEEALALPPDPPDVVVPVLRDCPVCGGKTFRPSGPCSACDGSVPARSEPTLSGRTEKSRNRSYRKRMKPEKSGTDASIVYSPVRSHVSDTRQTDVIDELTENRDSIVDGGARNRQKQVRNRHGRVDLILVRELVRAMGEVEVPDPVVNGLRLSPDEPHLDREKSGWSVGNRCRPGTQVSTQTPARDKALQLMEVPGEWEVLAFYQKPVRVKAAVWYLNHRVLPTLPAGQWEFRRCPWERAAVMGRFDPI